MSKLKMTEVVPFLERNVQWFAIGIAVLYVGFMGYTYIATPPVQLIETIGAGARAKPLLPGAIDPATVNDLVMPLEKQFNDTNVDAPKLLNVVNELKPRIDLANINVSPLALTFYAPHTLLSPLNPSSVENVANGGNVGPFDKLPNPPLAVPDGLPISSWTVIMTGAANPPTTRQDLGYVSLRFKLDGTALANQMNAAFGGKKGLEKLLQPEFAQVELLREELQSDGVTWSAAQVVPALSINVIEPFPAKAVLDSPVKENLKTLLGHLSWVNTHQDLLINPPFYPIAADAPPHVVPAPPAPPAGAGPVPVPGGAGAVPPASPAPVESVPGSRSSPGGSASPRVRGGTSVPTSDAGTVASPPAAPTAGPDGAVAPGAGVAAGAAPAAGQASDVLISCNDATVEEGKYYRYALRYKLVNTVFNTKRIATDRLAKIYAVDSPDPASVDPALVPTVAAAWTDKVQLEPSVRVFVKKVNVPSNTADFEVFEWKDGRWHKSDVAKLMPGDPVGNFKSTNFHWTLVDVRNDPHKRAGILVGYALLMDQNGNLASHTVADDAADPKFGELKALAEAVADALPK